MQSMTGYGRATGEADGRELTIEVKSVNHRYLDLSFRMPRSLNFAEETMRKAIGVKAQRGHFDIYISYVNRREDARNVEVDVALLAAYRQAMERMRDSLPEASEMPTLAQYAAFPEVLRVSQEEEDQQALGALVQQALDTAMDQLAAMRGAEGRNLQQDMEEKLNALEAICTKIAERAPQVAEDYRRRLSEKMEELLGAQVEEQRLLQEVMLFADKAAIDEELVRLGSHIGQLRNAFAGQEAVGRRLDFLVQELNREVNTIGSKAQDAELTALVVDAKGIIEKLREQVQNIE